MKSMNSRVREWLDHYNLGNKDRKVLENELAAQFGMTIHEAAERVNSFFNDKCGYSPKAVGEKP